jgi:hypothetical protein
MLRLLKRLKAAPGVEDAYPFGEYHHVVMSKNFDQQQLKNYLASDQPDTELASTEPNIEDCFMKLMKN